MLGALALALLSASSQVDPLAPLPEAPPAGPTPLIVRQPTPIAQPPLILQRPAIAPQAASALTGYAAYKVRLAALARSAGVREATIQSVVPFLSLNSRVIELDRAQRPTSTGFVGWRTSTMR